MDWQEQIDEIMDNFDFAKVSKAMQALNWTYAGNTETPTESELRETARSHLRRLAKEDDVICTRSGGFRAWKNDGLLALSFEVNSWEVELEQ